MIVLVPAYEPGDPLPRLVADLRARGPAITVVVIDDGSGPAFADVFTAARDAGATLVAHPVNRGKGVALRTGLDLIGRIHPGRAVVTADADGQHTPDDIIRIGSELVADERAGSPAIILGCRSFTGEVPWRSRVGNSLSRGIFQVAAGWRLSDTQTGLRGIPASLLAWVGAQPGDRFEFEQNVLLRARRAGVAVREVPIATVYLDGNASSHFRPVADSIRVALPLLLFAASSLIAFAIDTVALLAFTALSGLLVPSIIAARVLSASVNFAMNRRVVFRRSGKERMLHHAVRYGLLAVAMLATNIVGIAALTAAGLPLVVAKVLTEIVLFICGFGVQRALVFGRSELGPGTEPRHRNLIAARARMDMDDIPDRRTR